MSAANTDSVKPPHDPIVKGTGRDAYAICDACVRRTFRCVPLATGSRRYVNRIAREHRKAAR